MDFDSKIDYGPRLNTVIWLLVSVSAVFLFTRLYLKRCQKRGFWWDDYALLASWIALTAQAGLVAYIVGLGYGKDVATIPKENLPLFGPVVNTLSSLLIISNLLGKTSFALTLLRIPAMWMRIIVCFILVTLASTLGLSAILVWIQCLYFGQEDNNCIDLEISIKYNIFSCVYSATMDVVLAFLPWKFIWSLQMSKKERVGVVVAMSMGIFAGAAAAVKTTTLLHITDPDPLVSVQLLAWGNAESAICIMAASIPILRALIRGHFVADFPMGYETGSATMAESGAARTVDSRTQIWSRPWSPPPRHGRPMSQQRLSRTSIDMLDQTLVSDSPEPIPKKGAMGDGQDVDSSDEDSIEMINYQQARPQTPADFVR
ncbi:hypothetical protein B0H63DRAFT_529530 [Podospora didyma]|uniref:Rhodopsin domain-containing protein n=1 Tax=Podospora didyma TaxID=330526 RepID=A0AAE0K0K6_9PEZI|nr:hypothetical protein B0H63DRAFT_529530 [Podospora didyma]